MKKIVISYLFFLFLACCHWTGNICRAQSVFANPGTITGDQTIDANTQAQRIKNGVLPYCNVPYTFSWEYCWEDYYLSGFWSPIPGATSEYYDPGVVSRSTYYRRAINYTEGSVTKKPIPTRCSSKSAMRRSRSLRERSPGIRPSNPRLSRPGWKASSLPAHRPGSIRSCGSLHPLPPVRGAIFRELRARKPINPDL